MKGGPFSHRPFGPDSAAVAMDNPLHRSQADTSTGELRGFVEALEGAEKFIGIDHIEAGTVVPYEVGFLTVVLVHAELDFSPRVFTGKFPGITQQVFQ